MSYIMGYETDVGPADPAQVDVQEVPLDSRLHHLAAAMARAELLVAELTEVQGFVRANMPSSHVDTIERQQHHISKLVSENECLEARVVELDGAKTVALEASARRMRIITTVVKAHPELVNEVMDLMEPPET